MRDRINDQLKKVMDDPTFQQELKQLVAHYNVSASAKYTLEPRTDFVRHVVLAVIESQVNSDMPTE